MSDKTDVAVDKIVKALNDEQNRKPQGYDTLATVKRTEGRIAWVHIDGGVDETPVSMTVSCKKDDVVRVRVANGTAFIVGNQTNPPTDNTYAYYVQDGVVKLKEVVAGKANFEDLEATNAHIGYLEADTAKIHDLTADDLHATVGYIQDLTAESITAEDISASSGYIKDLQSENITAQNIVADHAEVQDLDANYAQIDAANVTELSAQNAWVNKIMVQTGLLAHSGTVFTLDAVQVNAANITAGTIDVERLIVTVDGEKYMVHVNPSTGTPSYEKLDGNIVEPRTITADKIVAHDITVQEITTENLVGTNGWINLNQGKFRYTTNGTTLANSTNGIEWDGTHLTIKGAVNITSGNVYTKTETEEQLNKIEGLYVNMKPSGSNLIFTAVLIQGGQDVTASKADGDFEWFYRTPEGDEPMNKNGKSITVAMSSQTYGRTVVCVYTRLQYAYLLNNAGNNLVTNTGAKLIGRSEY